MRRAWDSLRLAIVTALVTSLLGTWPLSRRSWPVPLGGRVSRDPLERGFLDPPASAKPRVWWHWMNGNVTNDGITAYSG